MCVNLLVHVICIKPDATVQDYHWLIQSRRVLGHLHSRDVQRLGRENGGRSNRRVPTLPVRTDHIVSGLQLPVAFQWATGNKVGRLYEIVESNILLMGKAREFVQDYVNTAMIILNGSELKSKQTMWTLMTFKQHTTDDIARLCSPQSKPGRLLTQENESGDGQLHSTRCKIINTGQAGNERWMGREKQGLRVTDRSSATQAANKLTIACLL